MGVHDFDSLITHHGHEVEVSTYGRPPLNVAIECVDCGEVLLDFDSSEVDNARADSLLRRLVKPITDPTQFQQMLDRQEGGAMDPDAALEAAVTAYERWRLVESIDGDGEEAHALLVEVAEKFAAIHDWIVAGGALPGSWARPAR